MPTRMKGHANDEAVPLRHTAMVRAHPTMMPRKANAAIAAFRSTLLALLAAGWRVY